MMIIEDTIRVRTNRVGRHNTNVTASTVPDLRISPPQHLIYLNNVSRRVAVNSPAFNRYK